MLPSPATEAVGSVSSREVGTALRRTTGLGLSLIMFGGYKTVTESKQREGVLINMQEPGQWQMA